MFFIAAAIYVVTNIFYCIFGSGEVQYWNGPLNKGAPTGDALSKLIVNNNFNIFMVARKSLGKTMR